MSGKQKIISQNDYERAGDKFELYIRESDLLLRSDEYIVVHLDGVKFTSQKCKHLSAVNKRYVFECLTQSAISLCNKFKSARIAYVAGDEISILLDGSCVKENYYNRVQKIVSLFVSAATLFFNIELRKFNDIDKEQLNDFVNDGLFAAKTFNITSEMVNDYFKWRLLSCKKLIFDRREKYDDKADWEKYGALITFQRGEWVAEKVDFGKGKLCKQPQDEHYLLKKGK